MHMEAVHSTGDCGAELKAVQSFANSDCSCHRERTPGELQGFESCLEVPSFRQTRLTWTLGLKRVSPRIAIACQCIPKTFKN